MAFGYLGARWIQRTGELANPYFGARMLHCGIFEQAGTQQPDTLETGTQD